MIRGERIKLILKLSWQTVVLVGNYEVDPRVGEFLTQHDCHFYTTASVNALKMAIRDGNSIIKSLVSKQPRKEAA